MTDAYISTYDEINLHFGEGKPSYKGAIFSFPVKSDIEALDFETAKFP
jgi:hypothetical protein